MTLRAAARLLLLAASGLAPILALYLGAPAHAETGTLRAVEDHVARRWPNIGHMTVGQLANMMNGGSIRLFDVRQEEEYEVSHIQGAVRIDPAIRQEEFLRRHADAINGRTVVFYCAVGERSSKLADSLAHDLKMRGALGINNLKGGIFAWHNDGRALVDGAGPTDFVHPYDRLWARVLTRRHLSRTKSGN